MKALGKLFGSRLFLAFLGLLFISLLIWFVGPMLGYGGTAPLQGSYNRLMAIGSLSLLWVLMALFRFLRSRRRNARMLDSLANEEPSANESASAEELQELQSKMQEAVDTLKQRDFSSSGGSRFIYELPWYVIIGPPGAGKTTLLSHSGLEFPLEETHGKLSIKGLGGTRNCDWWFTDQAVLLDTAGRYTTQDSEAEVDRKAWSGFLQMLREKRSRRPINGVLLALSIEDVLSADDTELEQTAKTLRTRIEELYQQLGIAPPVYLLLTKCDLLAGFSEFFADLNRQERQQVWGRTLALDETDIAQCLDTALNELQLRLNQQSIDKLQAETSLRNRENIYGFPMQFNFARTRVKRLLQRLTTESRLLQPILFRGVYFTSATQTGSVLDKVIQNVSHSFGITDRQGANAHGEGRSYFIQNLLGEVIFAESGLAGTNLKTEKRLKRLQWAAVAAMALVSLGLLAFWSASYVQNRQLIEQVQADAGQLQRAADALDPQSLDLVDTNTLLNRARALALPEETAQHHDGFVVRRAGLYQGARISELAMSRYDELLQEALLPRLMVRLEQQMHTRNTDSEFLFEALKTYQMIGLRERFVSSDVIGWFNFDIDSNFTADVPQQTRQQLKRHVARLFGETPRRLPRPLDESLIRQYQAIAAQTTLAQRAYNRLRRQAASDVNAFVRLSQNVSPELGSIYTRQDDVSLDQSIRSFHTLAGYRDVFLPASQRISQSLAEDAWVLGPLAPSAEDEQSLQTLERELVQQYHEDYIEQWQSLFDNLSLRNVGDLAQASQFIALVSDTDSPLKRFLVFASDQTTLTRPPAAEDGQTDGQSTARENELGSLLNATPAASQTPVELDPVTRHFAPLHALVEGVQSNTSSLDTLLNQLAELNIQLLPMAQSPAGTIDTALNQELAISLQKLTLKAGRLPEPLASMVSDLGNQINDVVGGGFCQQLDSAWKTDVLPFYQRAIRNRYPVNRGADVDIALTDFGAFFGPGGVIDTFVATYLGAQVQRTPGKWTWVGTGSAVCLSDNSLRQLALADDIRNTFFSAGGNLPSFRFDLVPSQVTMSSEIAHLFLDIGGSGAEYYHGPVTGTTTFAWPPASNNTQVSLRVEPVIPGTLSSINFSGPWSVLRLFERGTRAPRSSGLDVRYSFGSRQVSLSLASSSFNPLDSVALRNFRAPEDL